VSFLFHAIVDQRKRGLNTGRSRVGPARAPAYFRNFGWFIRGRIPGSAPRQGAGTIAIRGWSASRDSQPHRRHRHGARIAQFRQYRRALRPRCRSCIIGAVGMANHRAAGRRSHLPARAMRKYQNFSNSLELKLQEGHLVLALCCLGNKALPACRGNGKANLIREPATLPLG
jgi:hypothetical protein